MRVFRVLAAALALLLSSASLAGRAAAQSSGPTVTQLSPAGTNYLQPQAGDNYAALQAAFNNSPATPVYLACGTYTVSAPLSVPQAGIVRSWLVWTLDMPGSYPHSVPCATIAASLTSGNFGAGTAVVTLNNYADFEGIAVEGTNTSGQADAIGLAGRYVTLENNFLFDANNGIDCPSTGIGEQITHNLVAYNKADGLLVPSGCTDGMLKDNNFISNALGAQLEATAKWTVTGNVFQWSNNQGMTIYESSTMLVDSNQFDRNSSAGLRLNATGSPADFNITVSGNNFRRNGAAGTAGNDEHIEIDGTVDHLTMAGNAFYAQYINDNNTGIVAPNYVYYGANTPGLTNAAIADVPAAQNTGIYENAAVEEAVLPLLPGNFGKNQQTVSSLGGISCGAANLYQYAMITDLSGTPTYKEALSGMTGGGSTKVPMMCNGANWEAH